jgi:hypothetical protein
LDFIVFYRKAMDFKKQKQNLIVLGIISLLTLPYIAGAAGLVPCGSQGQEPCNLVHVFGIIARVTNWLLMIAGIYASYQIIQGGFGMIISMGNEESITSKKKQITNAVVGFVFTLMAFIIVYTVVNLILRGAAGPNAEKCKISLTEPLTFLLAKDECGKQ